MIFSEGNRTSQNFPDNYKSDDQGTSIPQNYFNVWPETDKAQAKKINDDRKWTKFSRVVGVIVSIIFIIAIVLFIIFAFIK